MSVPLLSAVRASAGIYGTAPTCYLSALARLEGFRLGDLEHVITVDRSLVRVRAMRYSVYSLPRDLLVIAIAATRRQALSLSKPRRELAGAYPGLSARVEATLTGSPPLAAADIRRQVDPDGHLGSLFSVLLGWMAAESRIVRATNTGTWRSDRLTYARWEDWLPDVDPHSVAPDEARRRLAEHYVAAYGPVDLADLQWWAGWQVREARDAADGLDLGTEGGALRLLDGVRLLPVWDVLLVAYRNRERLLDPDHARFLYDRFGNATSVVLDAGRVVGVWDLGRSNDSLRIKVAPLGDWPSQRWDDVGEQAQRIAAMVGAGAVHIEHTEPVDLVAAPRNRFLSPLSG